MKKHENELKFFIRMSVAIFFMFMPYVLFTIHQGMAWLFTLASFINFFLAGISAQKILTSKIDRIGRYELSWWIVIGGVFLFTLLSYAIARDTMPHVCGEQMCPHLGRSDFMSSYNGGQRTGSLAYKIEYYHFKHPYYSYEQCRRIIEKN